MSLHALQPENIQLVDQQEMSKVTKNNFFRNAANMTYQNSSPLDADR
jgi:hypothetical protein